MIYLQNKEMMDDLSYFVSLLEKITKEKLDEHI